jgi:transposase-like protein
VLQTVCSAERRVCPDCGSENVEVTQRGFAGQTDERHQFFRCLDCDRLTYEILSRNAREMKLDRVENGDVLEADGHTYRVRRILKIGIDEHLLYVRADNDARRELFQRRRRS